MNLSDGDMNFEPKMKKEICVFINLTTRYIISIYTCVGKYSKLTQNNCIVKGSDSGGLEPGIISWDGENESLGSFIFRSTYDIWKLCVI